MESQPPPTMVFFDLDNTLFNHKHSLSSAISAVQRISPLLHEIPLKVLAEKYNEVLNHVYDKYLRNEMAHEDQDAEKVKLFFKCLDLEEPDSQHIEHFRNTLRRLRNNGYRTAIITNGPTESQIEKAKAIGIFDLVERVITSQEVGHPKPEVRIFQYALEKLEVQPHCAYMIGDSVEADIKGAVNAKITPILYSPSSNTSLEVLCGNIIPVIHQFDQLPMALELRPLDLSLAVSAAQTGLQQA
ncbi:Glyceraldehyde 3-phosphate phosphatase [Fusarium oxysporum f. sp. raphani]|uniref:Glyceraldehyde 3-phosphate phosphatase n=1 Tax=Fusarium oxysporum f. sp. raphani TaxID=96318 RepID=A0A8J5QBX1_FUSOX|nr:Glyceraldehyde 3-phosphate phosphatase [Fusarium oxysporum f. sp. raphani]